MFRRKPRIAEPQKTWIEELVAEQRAADRRWHAFEPKDSAFFLKASCRTECRKVVEQLVDEHVLLHERPWNDESSDQGQRCRPPALLVGANIPIGVNQGTLIVDGEESAAWADKEPAAHSRKVR